MTCRVALASIATAIAFGGPAHANPLEPYYKRVHDATQRYTDVHNDWCVQVDGQDIVCPPWGYLPYDPRTILPPDQ